MFIISVVAYLNVNAWLEVRRANKLANNERKDRLNTDRNMTI